jgi:hypothetical protein
LFQASAATATKFFGQFNGKGFIVFLLFHLRCEFQLFIRRHSIQQFLQQFTFFCLIGGSTCLTGLIVVVVSFDIFMVIGVVGHTLGKVIHQEGTHRVTQNLVHQFVLFYCCSYPP